MRICLVVNTFPSVSETFIYNKALALASKGHKVHVVCYKKNMEGNYFYKQEIESSGIQIHKLSLSGTVNSLGKSFFESPSVFFQSLSFDPKSFRKNYVQNYYIHFFNKIKYDIIHFEFSGIGTVFLPVIDELKGKKVVSCRGTAEKVKLQIDSKRKELLTSLFRKVDLIHCVSVDMTKSIEPYCSDQQKIFVNTPAIDTSFFNSNKIKQPQPVVKIFSVGRLNFQKNYLTGLLAVKILVEKGYQFRWTIVGDGEQLEELQFHTFNLSLQKHVFFEGKRNRDEIKSMNETADIFLLTSVYEGIPNVVLEAMAMKLPVVTTRCGGVDEVIEHGIDGFIAELYDHVALAKYLMQLIDDVTLRNTIGVAAREKIVNNYTLERQTETFEKQYRSLF